MKNEKNEQKEQKDILLYAFVDPANPNIQITGAGITVEKAKEDAAKTAVMATNGKMPIAQAKAVLRNMQIFPICMLEWHPQKMQENVDYKEYWMNYYGKKSSLIIP